MIRLFFQGEFATAWVALIAIVSAVAVGAYYLHETKALALPHRYLLPALRGLAIALVIFMLAGPVIEYRKETGTIPTVNVFVDASDSMQYKDAVQNASSGNPDNEKTRLDRAAEILLGSETTAGWIETVKDSHRVKVHLLSGDASVQVYDSLSTEPPPKSFFGLTETIDRRRSNLANPVLDKIESLIGGVEAGNNSAATERKSSAGKDQVVVVLSDGQHNAGGESPEDIAKRMGDLSVPIFAIGLGQAEEPIDLAVRDIDVPPLVASNGRASGSLSIKDLGKPGDRFKVRITSGDKTAWERELISEGQPTRRVSFDFPVADLIPRAIEDLSTAVERTRTTLPIQVSVDPIDGEYDTNNNVLDYRLSASTRTRRVLIVDSRSRWETRYIRNVFERDPTWAVETLILWPQQMGVAALDEAQASFPTDLKTLAKFDVIIWGDVQPDVVSRSQLGLVRDFVSQGGGLVFVDGDRDHLSLMKDSPIGDLIPVRFASNSRITNELKLSLTSVGAQNAAMKLITDAGSDGEALRNAWSNLEPPKSIRKVDALPGAEVWLQATDELLQTDAPVLVTRLFGAGQVVYLATDQTWRWRYRVADLYHAKFWNQLLESIMQAPFDVRDQYVALATGASQYQADARASIRVQLRDSDGMPETDAVVDAMLKRDGAEPQVTPLRLIDASRGIYQGESDPLQPGNYVASVRAAGYAASSSVTSTFMVASPVNRENIRLAQNSGLLSSMAKSSGGVYADASNAKMVWDAIEPLSDGKIEVKRLMLAQSFYWFFVVLGLLTLEWWLRKRVGLV